MENLTAVCALSALACPDCGAGLWEMKETRPLRYRCRTGHAYVARSLDKAEADVAEHALWASMRALKEREMLLRRLAHVAQATGDTAQAAVGRRQADRVKAQAERLGQLMEKGIDSA